jgi:selenocysteine lyase/cysteine desulfurase
LHYNFVCALLNDLFGVQARGGCACAGPYGQALLGIDSAASEKFEAQLVEAKEIVRPGFVRVSFPYFFNDAMVDYVVNAVLLVADHGWRMLNQ